MLEGMGVRSGRQILAGITLVALVSCAPTTPFPLVAESGDRLVMALLDRSGRVAAVQVQDRGAPGAAFDVRLDISYPLVVFHLRPADFVTSDGVRVSAEALSEVVVRASSDGSARREGFGSCGRCLEPPSSDLQVVHRGDSCAPPAASGTLYQADGRLAVPVSDRDVKADGRAVLDAARQSLRLDWPGDCDFVDRAAASPPPPRFVPVSPSPDVWPVRAYAQTEDGVLGLFTEGPPTVVAPTGARLDVEDPRAYGRPRSAAGLPVSAGSPTRFVVAYDESDPESEPQVAFRGYELSGGRIQSRPAVIDGLSSSGTFDPQFMRWLPTEVGSRLVMAGGRGERPALAVCTAPQDDLRCRESSFEDEACASIGPVRDVVATPRGWLAVGARGFAQAPLVGDAPQGWTCYGAGQHRIQVRPDDDPLSVAAELHSVGHVGERVYACAEPVGYGGRAFLLTARLGGAGPFDATRLDWSLLDRADFGNARCGEFSPVADELEAATAGRIYADLFGFAVEIVDDGTWQSIGGFDLRVALGNRPYSGVLQRADGWLVARTGWPVEPRALGGGVLTRSATTGWEWVYGPQRHADLVRVVARETDFVAMNAFTDHAPVRIEGTPEGAVIEEVAQVEDSELEILTRESVTHLSFDSATGQVLLLGNRHVDANGGLQDRNDRTWTPFFRRLTPDLTRAVDVRLPLDRGSFVCAAAEVVPGEHLFVGGQGTLLLYDGQRLTQVPVDYDDPLTPEVEMPPIDVNTGIPEASFLAVDAACGVAWAVGDRGLIVRVARELDGGEVTWRARRFAITRLDQARLDVPVTDRARFTQVRALAPDHVLIALQRRTGFLHVGCPQTRAARDIRDPSGMIEIFTSDVWRAEAPVVAPGDSDPWPLRLGSWSGLSLPDGLPELVPGGLAGTGDDLGIVEWTGRFTRPGGASRPTPFFPEAVARGRDGRWVIVGPNLRVAISVPD